MLAAHEQFAARLPWPSLVVYPPFLSARHRTAFDQRAARLGRVTTLAFHEHLENLIEKAAAVACLGGYNTFCEVLSLGKPCLVVPPAAGRGGQIVRAEAARKLGLVQLLHPDQLGPETLADAVAQLPVQPPPAADTGSRASSAASRTSPTAVGWWRLDAREPRRWRA